jgi:hypothetical protein
MLGLRDSRILFTLGAALCCACPPAPTNDTDTDASTGSTTGSTTGSSTGSTTGEPTTGDASTGLAPSTGEGSTGEPAVTCQESACSVTCTQMVPLKDEDGQQCSCEESLAPPDDWQTCELDLLCGSPADYTCMVQALRWGVISRLTWYGFQEDDGGRSVSLDVLGDGTVRATIETSEEFACCDGSSQDLLVWYDPFTVPPPDDPFWQGCFTEKAIDGALGGGFSSPLPFCLDPKTLTRACTGAALAECPSPQLPGPGCPEQCPMAGDGICDETQGTALCTDGCDPLDCTCEPDTPGLCDEIHRGGACPIGSDPDDCTCEPNFPGQCDEIDGGGSCPTGSDSDCD